MSDREYRQMINRVLDEHPAITYAFGTNRRHNTVELTYGQERALVVFPASPSDHRGVKACRADIRRILRSWGLL